MPKTHAHEQWAYTILFTLTSAYFFNFYKSQLHTSTITTLKHELMNSLLTFSSRKVLRCRQSQIWFGLLMQSLCSKGDSVLTALHMAVEKFVCMRIFLRFQGTYDSEWVILKWSDETGWKFWLQNTCGEVKTNF